MPIHASFWNKVDQLVASSEIVIDRPRGTAHPRYPQMIYPVDYGYLRGTTSGDGQGIDVWRGSTGETRVNGLLCCVDVLKRDMEIKLLIGCSGEEIRQILALMNDSDYMQCDVVYRNEAKGQEMDLREVLALYDQEQRRDVEYPDARREEAPPVVRGIDHYGHYSFINYSQLEGEDVDRAIDEQIRYFESLGHDFEWKVFSHDYPADLKERLEARGFECDEPETIMVFDVQSAPATLLQPLPANILRITDPAKIDDVMAVENVVWNEDMNWLGERLRQQLRETPEYVSVYIAYVDGHPASSAWITFHAKSQFAGLWGGSTLTEYRGRGLYTGLLAARVQEARSRGIRFLTIDASPMSRPIVEKYGFQAISTATASIWHVKRET